MLHQIDMTFFRTLEERVYRRMLETSAGRVFSNGNSPSSPGPFSGFLRILLDKLGTSSKNSALVAFAVHIVLLTFSKEYKERLIQGERSLVAILLLEIL